MMLQIQITCDGSSRREGFLDITFVDAFHHSPGIIGNRHTGPAHYHVGNGIVDHFGAAEEHEKQEWKRYGKLYYRYTVSVRK